MAAMMTKFDYPRTRGVYARMMPDAVTEVGSSPHARGLLGYDERAATIKGIIPARAGFTPSPEISVPNCPDHPRTRGVYE